MPRFSWLECDHCGGIAVTSRTGQFLDGQERPCSACGMPGSVSVGYVIDTEDGEDIAQTNFYARLEEGDYCNRPDCDDCAEARKEAANG
jgi:hypothetical protein